MNKSKRLMRLCIWTLSAWQSSIEHVFCFRYFTFCCVYWTVHNHSVFNHYYGCVLFDFSLQIFSLQLNTPVILNENNRGSSWLIVFCWTANLVSHYNRFLSTTESNRIWTNFMLINVVNGAFSQHLYFGTSNFFRFLIESAKKQRVMSHPVSLH